MSSELQHSTPPVQDEETQSSLEDRAALYRQRVEDSLGSITKQTQQALAERGIGFDVFFLVPGSGHALVLFGTTVEPDPSDEQWEIASGVVTEVVRKVAGIDGARARELPCAVVHPAALK